jgi:hypothetical protein
MQPSLMERSSRLWIPKAISQRAKLVTLTERPKQPV